MQRMHVGPYDGESATVAAMHAFAEERGYTLGFSGASRADPAKMKTVVRHPIGKA